MSSTVDEKCPVKRGRFDERIERQTCQLDWVDKSEILGRTRLGWVIRVPAPSACIPLVLACQRKGASHTHGPYIADDLGFAGI